MIIFLPVVGFYLLRYFRITGNLGNRQTVIKDELKALGPMSPGEHKVMYVFILAVFGGVFREDIVLDNFIFPG